MNKILTLLKGGFESASYKTPEFASFSRKFKNALKKELASIGAEITSYNSGHFYVSGFFRKESRCYYFSLSDVRGAEYAREHRMLYRTARDEKDFTGGGNQYVDIADGMAEKMRLA